MFPGRDTDRSGCGIRFPCRTHPAGPRLDPAKWPGVAVPADDGASAAVETLLTDHAALLTVMGDAVAALQRVPAATEDLKIPTNARFGCGEQPKWNCRVCVQPVTNAVHGRLQARIGGAAR